MYYAFRIQNELVHLKKALCHHPVLGPLVFNLRIRKGDPYLGNLVFSKASVDKLDLRSQEGNILQATFQSRFRAPPKAGALDVNTDKILVWVLFAKGHRVFTLAASKL